MPIPLESLERAVIPRVLTPATNTTCRLIVFGCAVIVLISIAGGVRVSDVSQL